MDEQVNIDALREQTTKRLEVYLASHRRLVRTIDAAMVILAAFAAICVLVWLV
jgi:hypothetical protein